MNRDERGRNQRYSEWLPIASMPMIEVFLYAQVDEVDAQLKNLSEVGRKPNALDTATLDRIIHRYTEIHDDTLLYEEQMLRWREGPTTELQRKEIERMTNQMAKLREGAARLVQIAKELKKGSSMASSR